MPGLIGLSVGPERELVGRHGLVIVALWMPGVGQPQASEVGFLSLSEHQAFHLSRDLPGAAVGTARARLKAKSAVTTDSLPDRVARVAEISGYLGDIAV